MPTVLRIGSYCFFFYANEGSEPVHIHVQVGRCLAKFWLQPVVLASSSGFAARELTKLLGLVREHERLFKEAWHEFFNAAR